MEEISERKEKRRKMKNESRVEGKKECYWKQTGDEGGRDERSEVEGD